MRMTSKTRFSQYYVVRVRKPASFWQDSGISLNVVVAETSYQMLEVFSFCDHETVLLLQ